MENIKNIYKDDPESRLLKMEEVLDDEWYDDNPADTEVEEE